MATVVSEIRGKQIYFRLSIDRKNVFRRKSGFFCEPNDWSNDKKAPKQNNANLKKLETDLSKSKTTILENYNIAVSKNIDITAEWLQMQIDKIHDKTPKNEIDLNILTNYFDYYIENIPNRVNQNGTKGTSKRTTQKYSYVKNVLLAFEKFSNAKYKLKDIDIKFQTELIKYLSQNKGYSDNYTGRLITYIKTVCRDAKFNGFDTHLQLEKVKGYRVKIDKIFLTFDDLIAIERETFTREALTNAKDWLIIGCYIGQRVSDLLQLTKKNISIKNGLELIELTQQKTGKRVAIPLHPKVKELLDKREGEFPHKLSDQKFNLHIKDIAKLSGVNQMTKGALINPTTKLKEYGTYEKWQLVTSHICRRSFASNFYGDIPTALLINITGHSSEVQFLEYIGKTSTDYAQQLADFWTKETLNAKKEPVLKIVRNVN
jgi:integrase